jgi:predicted metalloprotease with PDZ domain
VSDSSFDAWIKFYKQDENSPNAIVSYYTKGALIALSLDHIIRERSEGQYSLDDIMRVLWMQYGAKEVGVCEGDIERVIQEHTGLDLSDFFNQSVRGCNDLDIETYLDSVGVGYKLRQSRGASDSGGLKDTDADAELPRLVLGVATRSDGKELVLSNVFDGGAAQVAGLSAGDTLIAIDGLRVSEANLDGLVTNAINGTPVKVHAFRRDEIMEFDVTPLPANADTCELWIKEDVDEATFARRTAWLTGL